MKKSPITTQKVIETYLPLGIVSFQCNWNGTRFLSPGTEFTSCVTCCQTTWEIGSWEIRKTSKLNADIS